MDLLFKLSGLFYFIWFAFCAKNELDIDLLIQDRKLLDEKIRNISESLFAIKDGFRNKVRKTTTTTERHAPTIAEKVYYIPLRKVELRKFVIDMTVDMNYLKHSINNESYVGNLKATADVNAKLVEEEDNDKIFRPVKKKDENNHFEYFSPMFKVNLNALPVGVHLYVPIHKKIKSLYKHQRESLRDRTIASLK